MRWTALVALAWLGSCEPAADGPEPLRYTVARGDTLSRIARRHGTTVERLREWNEVEGDLIEVGQVLLIWPSAEAAAPSAKGRAGGRSAPSASAASLAPLSLPSARPCLAPPAAEGLGGDEPEYASSRGLAPADVKASLDAFLPTLARCEGGAPGQGGVVRLQFEVGCDGRVGRLDVLDHGDLPPDLVACIQETLRYTPFPAHDLPDGEIFDYPLTVAW